VTDTTTSTTLVPAPAKPQRNWDVTIVAVVLSLGGGLSLVWTGFLMWAIGYMVGVW